MKITHLLVSGSLLASLAASPVLADTTATGMKSDNALRAKAMIACRTAALQRYQVTEKTALGAAKSAHETALNAQQAGLSKARSKEAIKAVQRAYQVSIKSAREALKTARQNALETWKANKVSCKNAS